MKGDNSGAQSGAPETRQIGRQAKDPGAPSPAERYRTRGNYAGRQIPPIPQSKDRDKRRL